ncbi:lantibiotic dehydratase [Actinokineospora fastidiosa]|uniref:Lantibiotic dehydratase n=1 Tax=Actinokineospora fastidiosa TaxID=1816 RepID=A0A918G9M5_9PSEU|nr:lantibiotic dehydratase [Actinokineospora fastidiosa]GGS24739.1 hypothetical protein GCM10010171_17420 [Actinokineospora fastidiosa]
MLYPWSWLRSTGFPFSWLDDLACPGLAEPGSAEYDDPAAFGRAVLAARTALAARMTEPAVTEALVLSNADVVDRMAALAEADLAKPTVRTRQRLRVGWSYLQRLCAKNETCSFFGPLAWGTVDPDAPEGIALDVLDPAAGRLRRRSVRFEHWVLRGVADALAATAPAAPYRLNPACDLDGDCLRVPVGKRVALPVSAARYVRAVRDGAPPPEENGVARLVAAGVLRREVSIPPGSGIDAVEHALGRTPVTAELEALRARFERETSGLAQRELLDRMRAVLTAAGVETARRKGTMYAGRLPVYEDCERNVRFRVGGRLARVLRDDLPPLLRLYRLVAECAASGLHAHYAAVAAEREAAEGTSDTDFPAYLQAVRASGAIEPVRGRIAETLRTLLNAAWAEVAATAQSPDHIADDDLAAVAAALAARFPDHGRFAGVLGVGVMSPDVLVAGRDVVLGEVHPCVAAAVQPVALPFLDEADAALELADRVFCGGRVVLAGTDSAYHRSQFAWPVGTSLTEVVFPGATSRCPPERTVPAGRGRVRRVDGMVRFVDRESGRTEDMVSVLSTDLQQVMFRVAGAVLGGDSTARLTYRGVVARRRSWSPDPGGLPDAPRPAEDFADFRALRAWAGEHGLPRRAFFRVDTEPKPVYLDWASPIAVDTFAKLARSATALRVTEFSPRPDRLWFADDLGVHTSELRMTYVV